MIEAYHAPKASWSYPRCRENYDKVSKIRTCQMFDAEALKIVQQLILEDLARKEIVIEALPTSNLCISYYQHLKEYHLKKWLEVEEENRLLPPVVLGSDDPGVFMTNIYNEYALAYMHLEKCNCSASRKMEKTMHLHNSSNIYKFCRDDR